jgi:hypothetical protein
MYTPLGTCRVCALADDVVVSELDKDLLEGMDITTILYKYSGKFSDPLSPLTRTVLYSHRRHLRRSIPAAILQITDLGTSSKQSPEETNLVRSEGFDSYVGTMEKDKEMVDVLVNSAMEDLISSDSILTVALLNPQDASLVMSVRNQLRKSLGELLKLNKEMVSPVLSFNIGDTNKKLFIEFLLIVKKAAEASITDEDMKSNFLLEITSQLRKSKEFKSVLEEERDRRDIIENVEKEKSV